MTTAAKEKTIRERISDLVAEAYNEHELNVIPIYPNVLVKLLPRATQTASGLYLPEKHNKILIEAVVLAIYEHTLELVPHDRAVQVGDHVMFRYHLGAPVGWLDGGTGEYRLVSEKEIECTLDYAERTVSDRELTEVVCMSVNKVEALRERYHLIPKNMRPLTSSGA